eukprot:350241_1
MSHQPQDESHSPKESKNILHMLDIDDIDDTMEQELFKQFINKASFNKDLAFDRIKLVQDIYQLWISKKIKSKSFTFYDAINKGLGEKYNFDALLRDYRFVTENKN